MQALLRKNMSCKPLFSLAFLVACAPGEERTPEEEGLILPEAFVQGRIEETPQTFQTGMAENHTVNALRVRPDGTTEVVSVEPVDVDVPGNYLLFLQVADEDPDPLLIQARSPDETWDSYVLVSERVVFGATAYPAPMDLETSAEGEALLRLSESVQWDAQVMNIHALRAFITRDFAVAAYASGQGDAAHQENAEAALGAMVAWHDMLVGPAIGATPEEVQAGYDALRDAQVKLDRALHRVGGQMDEEEARQRYLEDALNAWLNAGFSKMDLSASMHAAAHAANVQTGGLPAGILAELDRQYEVPRALVAVEAVHEELMNLTGQFPDMNRIEDASEQLITRVKAASRFGARAEQEILLAWSDYEMELRDVLQARYGEQQAEAIRTFWGDAEEQSRIFANRLSDAVLLRGTRASAESVTEAMQAYWMGFQDEAFTAILRDAGINDQDSQVISNIAAIVNPAVSA